MIMYTVCVGSMLTLNVWEDPFSRVTFRVMSFTKEIMYSKEVCSKRVLGYKEEKNSTR